MHTRPPLRNQDFYCSFTHLPDSTVNADELPYTLHSPHTSARLRTHPSQPYPEAAAAGQMLHRRTPSAAAAAGLRPDSFDSSKTGTTSTSTRSFRSFLSWTSSSSTQSNGGNRNGTSSSSSGRRKLVARVKQLLRVSRRRSDGASGGGGGARTTLQMLRHASRKPSTLDFRCIGAESRISLGLFAVAAVAAASNPLYDAGGAELSLAKSLPPQIDLHLPSPTWEDESSWGTDLFDGIR